jgi:exopolysaccharide biosynthesis polyprenyl glycosylphosphotransferase
MDAAGSAWSAPEADAPARAGNEPRSGLLRPRVTEGVRSTRPAARGSRAAKVAVVLLDTVAIALAMALAAWIRRVAVSTPEALGPIALTGALALPVWLCVFARYKLYTAAAITSVTSEVGRLVHAVAAGVACTALISLFVSTDTSRVWLLLTLATALPVVVIERALVRQAFRRARARGQLRRRVVVIGTNAEALSLVQMLRANAVLGYEVLGLLECGDAIPPISPVPVLGSWEEAPEIVQDLDATGVIIATSAIDTPVANRLARELIEMGCHVELTSGLVDISADRLLARPLGRRAVMYIEPVRRVGWRAVTKRMFDLALAGGGLFFTAPILVTAAILIKLDSRGPVFFSQVRVGKDGKLFRVRKLRTMVVDAERQLDALREQSEVDGPLFKMHDDPRVTRIGRLLRATSIDELPQMWNVIRGEMSVVGPRPALPSEASEWTEDLHNRLRVKPGITGMWQVNGRSTSSFDDYVRHDLYYVDNWSLLTDLAIIAKTIPVVLLRRGAY